MENIHHITADGHKAFVDLALTQIVNALQKFHGPRLISLSGGNTPYPIYEKLGQALTEAAIADDCYWVQTDERLVEPESERANQHKIRQSLLGSKLISDSNFFAVPLAHEPCNVASRYFESLMYLPPTLIPPHPPDLLILGMGTDGHTASLFPGTDWRTRSELSGYAVFEPESQQEKRLSLTIDRILEAKEIIFLVSGTDKKEAFAKVVAGCTDLPAAYVSANRPTTWICNFT